MLSIKYLKTLSLLITIILISCKKDKSEIKDKQYKNEISKLISKMTLEEKIGQLNLRGTSSRTKSLPEELKDAVRKGNIGAFLNVMNSEYVDELQRIAIEESPNGIPLIFARDVIHGFKTIFPIPLGLAASWNEDLIRKTSEVAAFEASSMGIRWTFAPMLDISRDSRWGRIAESPGEDPYLASILSKAYIEGFQGNDLSDPTKLAACAKHYLAYGAAIGGRDYNTVNISEPLLRNIYLPPFKAAIESNVATVMTSFNEINGIPSTANQYLLKDVLREEMKFNGFTVSDWNSTIEMINHGFAKDEKHVAELSAMAGLDMEMTSKSYENYIKELIKEGKLTENQIDVLVKNILGIKFKLGLFENPYRNKNHSGNYYAKSHLELAKKAAIQSTVLLKNNSILPIKRTDKIAIIGPLANAPHEQLGTWAFDGEKDKTITPLMSFKESKNKIEFVKGLQYSRDTSTKEFSKAKEIANNSDIILFFGGEEAILSGEAHSRANINLPGAQEKLIKELSKTKKPIVLVIMAGRAISLENIKNDVDAIIMAWHPGTMGGEALRDIIYGTSDPKGKLPISWPKTVGQLPYFYNHKNTGRPADSSSFVPIDKIPIRAWQSSLGNNSHYLDVGFTPEYPFGFGLSYTKFKYSNLEISKDTINFDEKLNISISVTNIGDRKGSDVVQLYIQDIVGSITRPVKELKKFKHLKLEKGESKKVFFTISSKDLEFVNNKLTNKAEEGDFNLWVGNNSASGLKTSFYLKQ